MQKDYYKILGVDRNVTAEEMKKAFRDLSKEHHPDHGGNVDKFKEINEAHTILSDPEKRMAYDNPQQNIFDDFPDFFNTFSFGKNFRPVNMPMRGRDLKYHVEISLYESICGDDKEFEYTFKDICHECKGVGGTNEIKCQNCNGAGIIAKVNEALGFRMVNQTICNLCKGRGVIPQDKCEICEGSGDINRSEKIIIKLPPGVSDRAVLRAAGKGYSGRNDGPTGDLLVKLQIKMPRKEELTEEQLELLKTI